MNPDLVIATSTLYQNLREIRARLALKTIETAKIMNIPIIISDSSPNLKIRKAFEEKGAIVFRGPIEMGPGRRQIIEQALKISGKKTFIVWMEPEKYPLVPLLLSIISQAESIDMIIPGRKSLKSYPLSQQYAEPIGNRIFYLLTGLKLDVWFGPRIFVPECASFFLDYQGEYGDKWDSIFIPILRAIKAGKKITGIDIDYTHPKEQTVEEEKHEIQFAMKRIQQLNLLTNALVQEWSRLL